MPAAIVAGIQTPAASSADRAGRLSGCKPGRGCQGRHESAYFLRPLVLSFGFFVFRRAPTGPLILSVALRAGTAAGPSVATDLAGDGDTSERSSLSLAGLW